MNYLKIKLIVFATLLITSCAQKSESYLSTGSALEKYNDLLKNQTFFLFPELRKKPIKWFDSIPEVKIKDALHPKDFVMSAQPGEFYVFQVGVWALKSELEDVQVEFSDLKGKNGKIVSAARISCFNKGGIDFRGNPLIKEINIQGGRVQSLWMGIDLDGIETGTYSGSVSVVAEGEKQTVPIQLKISGEAVPNHGYNEGKRLSRLNCLNSTIGIDKEVTKGYLPVKVEGNTITILGRTLSIAENGLPSSIISYFGASNQSLVKRG